MFFFFFTFYLINLPAQPGNYESMLLPKVVKQLMVASVWTICAHPDILDLKLLIQMQFLLQFMYIKFEKEYQVLRNIIRLLSPLCAVSSVRSVTLNLFLQQEGSQKETGAEDQII